MSKKGFHPGSFANQKRVQEAEEKAAAKRKYDEETLAQYQKEQELYLQRSMVSKESREKLSLAFMYDQPPGTSQKGDSKSKLDEQMPKFEIKREHKTEPIPGSGSSHGCRKTNDYDGELSDDDGPRIKLEWKREQPKAKNKTTVVARATEGGVGEATKKVKMER